MKNQSIEQLFTVSVHEKLGHYYQILIGSGTMCYGNLILLGDPSNLKIKRRYEKLTGKKLPKDRLDAGIEIMEVYKAINL